MSKLSDNVSRLVKPVIRDMKAYHVAPSDGMLKLDAMENPYVWSDDLKQEWLKTIANCEINRYPSAAADEVVDAIRKAMNVPEDLDVMLGNGSDELIQLLALALDDVSMLSVEPAFVMYKVIADTVGMDYYSVLLNDDFSLNMDVLLETISEKNPGLIFLAVPNNPTGNCFDEADLRKIIEQTNALVVIDEAYVAFTDADMLSLASEYDNVLVMRTFSKMGLAGLRLGMLFGKKAWIEEINKIRLPYNINVLTQATTLFALQHYDVLLEQAEKLKSERQRLMAELIALDGVEVFPSEANFLLVRTEKPAEEIHLALKESSVLVKCLANTHPLLNSCLRITVSTEEENSRFMQAFKHAL